MQKLHNRMHSLRRIKRSLPLEQDVKNNAAALLPMRNRRRETVAAPARGITPRNVRHAPLRRTNSNVAVNQRVEQLTRDERREIITRLGIVFGTMTLGIFL
jgi:hypothetical protein